MADISGGRIASGCEAAIGAATLTANHASSHERNDGRSVGDRLGAAGGRLGCLFPLAPRDQRLFERRFLPYIRTAAALAAIAQDLADSYVCSGYTFIG